MDEMSQETRGWYMRLAGMQKTSDELRDDGVEDGDWQEGYDHMVRTARVQADEIERLRAAIRGIAPWLSASLSPKELGGLGSDAGPEYRAACQAIFEVDDS